MARAQPLPPGNDPRQRMEVTELEEASLRALPQVAKRSALGDNLGLIAGMAGVLVLGAITFMSLGQSPKPQPPAPTAPVQVPTAPPESVLGPVDPSANLLNQTPPALVQPMPPVSNPDAVPPPVATVDPSRPTLMVDNSAPPGVTAAPAATPGSTGSVTLSANDQFASRVNGDIYQKAQRIGNPSRVVPQGAVIPAVLETAINSDLPGYTRAIVSRDIRSFDGTTVLIPRGSRLVGQYKSGLTSGETRAFIIWNRLIRPDGLSVQLASPATDDLGQAGMTGKVDSHFVKRFGSSILLSIVNGLSSALGSKNSSTIVIGSSGAAQSVIGEALSNDAKIPPTIKVPQGAMIQVFAARDLDFELGT